MFSKIENIKFDPKYYILTSLQMVGQYKRKTNFQSWGKDCMQRAIQAVENKEMGWLKAAKQYGVPQATLRRRVSNGKNKILRGTEKGLGRYKCTFDKNLERELVDHIKLLESRMFGLTAIEVRILAYQLAEMNDIEHRFNKVTRMAG